MWNFLKSTCSFFREESNDATFWKLEGEWSRQRFLIFQTEGNWSLQRKLSSTSILQWLCGNRQLVLIRNPMIQTRAPYFLSRSGIGKARKCDSSQRRFGLWPPKLVEKMATMPTTCEIGNCWIHINPLIWIKFGQQFSTGKGVEIAMKSKRTWLSRLASDETSFGQFGQIFCIMALFFVHTLPKPASWTFKVGVN
jgi:hypothetical protein